jgi:hypothetical protein
MAEPLLSVRDAEQAAARVLTADIRDFIAGGSEAEVTLAANRAALDAVFLVPRVLTGITTCVDLPRIGRRLRDMRNAFTLPPGVTGAGGQRGAAGAPRPVGPGQRRPGRGRAGAVAARRGTDRVDASGRVPGRRVCPEPAYQRRGRP